MVIDVGGAQIEVEKAALQFEKSSGRFHGWLGYALQRRIWVDGKFREKFPDEPSYRYTFDEEFQAREGAAKIWAELRAKEGLTDPYFKDLEKVDRAGFLREYVWFCVPHPEWQNPTGLRQAAFSEWLSANLPAHQVETWVAVRSGGGVPRVILGVEAHPPQRCRPSEASVPSNRALNQSGADAPAG